MTVQELISLLERIPDDQLEIIVKIPHALTRLGNGAIVRETKYYGIHDIEDQSDLNHYNLKVE